MNRRKFVKAAVMAGISTKALTANNPSIDAPPLREKEVLYNGIVLPEIWPPTGMNPCAYSPMPLPYLSSPPNVIPIDLGRQLFVDNFLIESTSLIRQFHNPRKYDRNPIFEATTSLEKGSYGLPQACPKDGGIWWDPDDNLFKMWYEAGWTGSMAYAVSDDGLNWRRPSFSDGTNRILPDFVPDSTTIFLDHHTDKPGERFKLFMREPNFRGNLHGFCSVSGDGINWGKPVKTGYCGDRSTIFYNPFRKKWVYSLRSIGELNYSSYERARFYYEHDNFLEGANWGTKPVFWTGADYLDHVDPATKEKPQLYNLSAVAYESLMIGFYQVHLGPRNEIGEAKGVPKTTELMMAYSRDGFHWDRPVRDAFIPATRIPGNWERGYVQSVGGLCTVVGDELWFYYAGFRGDQTNLNPDGMKNGMYAHGSLGVAALRRDGFASMEAKEEAGHLTTRCVTFTGNYLFANLDCARGEMTVEILDEHNHPIIPFTRQNFQTVSGLDKTICQLKWSNQEDLSALRGKKVRFRFHLKNGKLFSFWVSPDKSGASNGYLAGGAAGSQAGQDKTGLKAYRTAEKSPKLLS